MATVREYFDTDFVRLLKSSRSLVLRTNPSIEVAASVHFDFEANAKFLSVFMPMSEATREGCLALAREVETLLTISSGASVAAGQFGERPVPDSELVFSRRLFVYHESALELAAQEELAVAARQHGVFLQLRGPQFADLKSRYQKPRAFICHDSRDKDQVARPIAYGLAKRVCPVWFDEFSLKVGDRLRESIERGLKEARKCILVLTPNFLSNSGWTKAEFNSIFTRELVEAKDVILPVWCGVTREQVYEYSPSLADRVAANWAEGEEKVVGRLHHAIRE